MGYESSAERWSPVQSVEKILLSVVSMLAGKDITKATPTAKDYRRLKLINPLTPTVANM